MTSRFRHRSVLRLGQALQLSLLIGTCLGSSVGISWAGPEGGVVSQGNATINQNGNTTTINQTSNRALLDWQSFNIGQNESVNFIQTGPSAIAINRIHDANPSTILGSLSANGQIMLINPNGVVFGNGAKVDVGSLVVSTASPTDKDASDFISGARNDLNLSIAGNPDAHIINNGIITAKSAGLVGFVAPAIINNGVIVANKGTVQLASGSTATLDLYGDGLVDIAVSPDVEHQLIEQRGWVQADGGKVVITAAAGEHIVNSVINMGGVTQANSIEQKDGKIILRGDDSTINVTGKITASGHAQSQKGGAITVTAKHINLKSGSVIDTSGDKGGGTIKIGGDYKGQGTLSHADTLTMDSGATIYNDAISSGNGGTTILWSDHYTYFAGDIFARGGSISGNGGFVETSGKKDLAAKGRLDLSAAHGGFGTWLLDPTDITIYNRSNGTTDNVNTVTTAYLESQGANIVLTADNNLILDMTGDTMALGSKSLTLNATSGSITSASDGTITTSGNINLNAGTDIILANDVDFTTSGSGAVTLRANTNIAYSGSGDITTAGGDIILNSDRDATGGGGIYLGAGTNLKSNGGNITLGGGLNPTTTNAIGMSTAYPQGIYLTAAVLDARGVSTGGNISLRGQGSTISTGSNVQTSAQGMLIDNVTIQTNLNGTLTLSGTGTGSTGYNLGVFLYSATNLSTVNGNISITGTGGNGGAGYGIALSSSGTSKIQSTGTGNISLTGTGYAGILLNSANGGIINKDGNITLTGTALNGGTVGIGSTSSGNGSALGSATSTGNISLISNNLSWSAGISTIQTAGDVIIRPNTAATTVGIGSGAGTLSITDALLNNITYGGTLWLGGYTPMSDYWVSSGHVTINSTRNFAKDIYVVSGADILSGGAGGFTTTGGSIRFYALNDINISHDFDLTSSSYVYLRAAGSISYSNSGDITTNGGAITLNADYDGVNGGKIALKSGTELRSNGGNIILGGGNDPTTGYAQGYDTTYGVNLAGASLIANGTASGGTITMNGKGWADASCGTTSCIGVIIDGSTLTTNFAGAININGFGGGISSSTYVGAVIVRTGSTLSTVNGNINLTGQNISTMGTSGTLGFGGGTIQTTGTGNINLTSTSPTGNGSSGLDVYAATNFISGGNITYIGNTVHTGVTHTAGIFNAAGDIIIRPYSNSVNMGIGGALNTLQITDMFLGNLTWGGTLWLGGYGLTGAESGYWNSAGSVTLATNATFAKNVNILSGTGNILSGAASGITLTGGANALLWATAGDINMTHDFDITATGTGSVTLRAGRHIGYSASGDITTNGGAITLNSDRDADNAGAISLGGGTALISNGGNITLGGGINPAASAAIGTSTSANGIYMSGVTLDARGASTTGGNISVRGQGWNGSASSNMFGIYIDGTTIQTNNNGTVTIQGQGGNTSTTQNSNYGVSLANNALINAVNGVISVTGTGGGGAGSANHHGIVMATGSKIESTGSGDINLVGTGGATAGTNGNVGILIGGTASVINKTGKLTLTGIYTTGGGSFGLYAGSGGTLGSATSTGAITLIANTMSWTPIIQTAGDVIIRPYSNGSLVYVGTGGTVNDLQITDAVLNNITTGGTLWLGGYGLSSGDAGYWNSSGIMSLNTTRTFTSNVNFISGNNLVSGGASTITLSGAASAILSGSFVSFGHDLDVIATGTGNITVRSLGSIAYTGSGDITTNGGTITLNSNRYNTAGAISLGSGTVLTSNGGNIVLGGGTTDPTTGAATGNSGYTQGIYLNSATLDARGTSAGGNIIMNGQGWTGSTANDVLISAHGIYLNGSTVQTNFGGTVNMNGTGGGTGVAGLTIGIYLYNNSVVSSVNGAISLTGMSGTGTGGQNHGITFSSSGTNTIQSTGTGAISLSGVSSSADATSNSIAMNGITSNILSAGGDVNLTGISSGNNTIRLASGTIGGAAATGTITMSANKSINLGSTISTIGNGNVTLNSGSQITTLSGNNITTVNGTISLTASSGISLSHQTILTSTAGNIALNSTVTSNVTQTFTAGGIITANAISMGANNLTLTADDVVLKANVTGTGTLTLQPYTMTRNVNVISNSDDNTSLHLNATELTRLVNGWGNIIIGRSDGTGTVRVGSSTWVDPVTFRNNNLIQTYDVTGTDNASLTFTGAGASLSRVDMYGNIVTAGGAVDFSGLTYQYISSGDRSITTNGGNVTFSRLPTYTSNGNLVVNTNGGNIAVNTSINSQGIGSNSSFTFNAGTGTVAFGGTVNTDMAINVSGNAIIFNGAWGNSTNLGNVTLTSASSITLPAITLAAGKTLNTTVTGTGNSITASTIAAGSAGNVNLISDDVVLNGNITGTGTLTIQPYTAGWDININRGTADGSNLNLSTAEIARLVNGWSAINIGRIDGTGDINIGLSSWADPVTFRNNYRMTVYGTLTGTDNASFTFNGGANGYLNQNASIVTNGQNVTSSLKNWNANGSYNITTSGGSIVFNNRLYITNGASGFTYNTSGGNISIAGPVSDYLINPAGQTITMNAGTGVVSFGGNIDTAANLVINAGGITAVNSWGATTPLGDVTLTSGSSITLPSNITLASGKTFSATVTGATGTITANAIAVGTGGNIVLTADDLILNGNLSGTGSITLQPYATNRIVNVNYGVADGSNLNLSTAEIARLVNGWSMISINRSDNTTVNEIGSIGFVDPVTFYGRSKRIWGTVSGTDNASIMFAAGAGTTEFTSNANITTAGQAISFASQARSGASSAVINSNGGTITFSNSLLMNANTSNITISTGNGTLNINQITHGNAGAKALTLNAGTGTINFGGTVNTDANVTATANAMTFGGAWGGTTSLGDVTLTSASSISLPAITMTAGKTFNATVTAAAGTITASAIAVGTGGNITLTADDLVLNGLLSGTGTVTLQPYATNRIVAVNYGTADGTNLNLSTADIAQLTNGWSAINIGRDDSNANIEIGTSTWSDPVTFRNNYRMQLYGNITGTDDASITLGGGAVGWVNLLGRTITTNGGTIVSNRNTLYSTTGTSAVFNSNGGAVTLYNLAVSANSGLIVNSGNGDISIAHSITDSGVNDGATTTILNAGTGKVTFAGTVNSFSNFTVNAGNIIFGGAWGGTTSLGNVTLTSDSSVTLPAITLAAGKTFDATVTGAANTITASTVAVGTGGNISLTADDLILNGALSGTGNIILQPYATSRVIRVNSATADGTVFHLSTTDLSRLTDGWSNIYLGRTDSTVATYFGTSTWNDPLTTRTPSATYFDGTITGGANVPFVVMGSTYFRDGSIVTTGQNVTFGRSLNFERGGTITTNGGNVTVALATNILGYTLGASTISTAGGNIGFTGSVVGSNTPGTVLGKVFTADAGTGTITFGNSVNGNNDFIFNAATINTNTAWGNSSALGNLTLTSVNNVLLPTVTMLDGKTFTATVTGAGKTITAGAITAGVAGNVILTADDLILNGNLSGTGTITLQPYANTRLVNVNYGSADGTNFNLSTAEVGRLVDGWGLIRIGRNDGAATLVVGGTSWSDPVKFQNNYRMELFGDITGTDNAAFTFGSTISSWLNPKGRTVTTAGGDITVMGNMFYNNLGSTTFNSNGGNVALYSIQAEAGGGLTVNSGNGNISIANAIIESNNTAGVNTSFNAGTGTVAFGNTVNMSGNISATGSNITFNGAWGATKALGDVTLTSNSSITLPAVTLAGNKTFSATVTGAGNSITASTIAAGTGGNITLSADDMTLNGNLSGTGNLTIRSYTSGRMMNIVSGATNGTSLYLESAEIAKLVDGWSNIYLGSTGSVGNIGNVTFVDPVTFLNGMRVFGALNGNGNASITFASDLYTAGGLVTSVNTAGNAINLNKVAIYGTGNDISFNSNGGNITIANTVNTYLGNAVGVNVTFNAGTGAVSFGNAISGFYNLNASGNSIGFNGAIGVNLGDITLTSASSIILPSITTTAGKTVSVVVTGAGNSITGSTIAVGTGGNVNLTADDLALNGNISGTGILTLKPYAAGRVTNFATGIADGSNFNLSTAEIARLTDGWSNIKLGRSDATAFATIGASSWIDPITFINARGTTLSGDLSATGDGSFTFQGANVDINRNITTAGQKVDFSGAAYLYKSSLGQTAAINTNGGDVLLNRIMINSNSAGGLTINSGGGNINIANTIYGSAASTAFILTLDAGTGAIAFGNTVNTEANITATANAINFNGAWGDTTALGNVTLTSASDITLPAMTLAAGKTFSASVTGVGNKIIASTIATGTGGNITLTADDLTLNGNLSGTGTITLQPYAVDRVVNINRNNDDGSSFHLNTAELSRLVDGWGLINVGRTNSTAMSFYGVSAWRDAVAFRGTGSTYVDGAITGTDDAGFTFSGSTYFRDGSVTTAGENVTFNSHLTFESGGAISTNGGTLTANGLFRLRDFTLNPVIVATSGGNINLNGALIESGNTSGKTLTLNAGTGTIAFGSTVDGAYNLDGTGSAISFNSAWGGTTPLGTITLTSGSTLSLPSMTANNITVRTTGATSDIIIGNGQDLVSTGAGGITLVAARNFINQSGADALTANNGGRWLVYSTDVTGTVGEETLANNFNRYSCTYGGTCPTLGTGNGFLYSYAPVLTITPTIITTVYGDALTGLNGYSYNVSGYLGSDISSDTITGTLNGTTGYVIGNDVGAYDINYANGTLASALGYSFVYADRTNGINVTARTLTAALTGTVQKIYDGNSSAALSVGNYTLSNIYNGDDVALGNITSGTYNDQNVGNSKTVSVNGLFLGGAKSGNYVLASSNVSGTVGQITPKGLTVTATAGQNKTYGAGNTALGYNYTGLVGTDTSATFTGALGRTAGENAGLYAINQGTLATSGNYMITSFVSNDYTINKAAISITGPNGTRAYGYDNPNFNWSNAIITGLQNGETGAVLDNLTFNVAGSATATANAGTNHTINLGGFSDNNYTLGSFMAGTLNVTKAQLTIVADSKVRLVVMPQPELTASFYGLRNNETEAVVSGLILSSNANANSPIGTYTITASGANAANYNINYVSGSLLVTPGALPTTVLNPAGIAQSPITPSGPSSEPLQNSKDSKDGPAPVAKWEEPLTNSYVGNDPLVTFTPELREMLGMGV